MDIRAARDLGEQGFDVLLALTYVRQQVAGKAWITVTPRLSPYVFVGFQRPGRLDLGLVKDTLGVASVVTLSAGLETEVPPETISGLRVDQLAVFEAASRRVRRKPSAFAVGDLVTVRDGPFAGQRGRVLSARLGAIVAELGAARFPVRLLDADVTSATDWQTRRPASASTLRP